MIKWLTHHHWLPLILFLYLLLASTYSALIPLGEAPDEQAHLIYSQFLVEQGHLPTNLVEREAAGYRSDWPPLYYLLSTLPLIAIGDQPPTRLKGVGDTPRRLIPTNGQTIAAFIHTADEAWPWRGLPLAWHLNRLISVGLSSLALTMTYLLAWTLTQQRRIAIGAAAIQAFAPQPLFISSVVNDDNLLILLAAAIFLLIAPYLRAQPTFGVKRAGGVGILLGAAIITKYNGLPLWGLVIGWGIWLGYRKYGFSHKTFSRLIRYGIALLSGAILAAGWWFLFIWIYFNNITAQGLFWGSLAALTATTHDASLNQLAAGGPISLNQAWGSWFVTLFQSFWGRFGGGGSIPLAPEGYWLIAFGCVAALTGFGFGWRRKVLSRVLILDTFPLLVAPLFMLILPILRFILTEGNISESAQGRHLFPALPAIAVTLAWGLVSLADHLSRRLPNLRAQRVLTNSYLLFPLLLLGLSLSALPLIRQNYPPPIPLRTTAEAATASHLANVPLAEAIELIGYEIGPTKNNAIPITLVWRATAIPAQDYLIQLTVTDPLQHTIGSWLGHPLGGRYPTRAWDKGDILRHTIRIPLLANLAATQADLTLQLLDPINQPTREPFPLATQLVLPPTSATLHLPAQLRADELASDSGFTYRSTLSFVLPDQNPPPQLIAPEGEPLAPAQVVTASQGSIVHFIVAAHWPSGIYQLNSETSLPLRIENRPRQFEPPSFTYPVEANFGGVMTLVGYDLPQRRLQPGQRFPITLHWRAEQTMGEHLTVFNHLLDQTFTQYGGADRIPLQYYTSLLWVPGEVVSDAYEVPVVTDAPPGVYWLDVGLYPSQHPELSLPLVRDGQPLAQNSVPLGPIKIGGPPPQVTRTEVQPQQPIQARFGEQISLLGFDVVGRAGQPLSPQIASRQFILEPTKTYTLTLYWQAFSPPDRNYTIFVHLRDEQGNVIKQFDGPPAQGAYPTILWDPGEIVVDERPLSDIPPGRYQLFLGLYQPQSGLRLSLPNNPEGALQIAEFRVVE